MPGADLAVAFHRAASLLLPTTGFAGCGSTLQSPPAGRNQPKPIARDGLSLACMDFPSPGCPDRVADPGLPLRLSRQVSLRPGPPRPPDPQPKGSGSIIGRNPLPELLLPVLACTPVAAPLQDFHPSGSCLAAATPCEAACAQRDSLRGSLPSRHARSLFAPRRPVFKFGDGSSFRVRYVPSGSLFRVPLGTICMMDRNASEVKRKMQFHQDHPRTLFVFRINLLPRERSGYSVNKTKHRTFV